MEHAYSSQFRYKHWLCYNVRVNKHVTTPLEPSLHVRHFFFPRLSTLLQRLLLDGKSQINTEPQHILKE